MLAAGSAAAAPVATETVNETASGDADLTVTENGTLVTATGMDVAADADQRPTVTATVQRVGETDALRYELSLADLAAADRVALVVGRDAAVTSVDGLSVRTRNGRAWLRPTDGTDRAAVTLRTSVSAADRTPGSGEYFASDDWVLGPVPLVELRWQSADRWERENVFEHASVDEPLTTSAGQRYALVGDQGTTAVDAAGGTIRIVTPDGTRPAAGSDDVAAALADAAERLDVGDRGDDVLMFALDAPARRGGESFPDRDEGWVHAGSGLNDPNSVWLHEYVHTRQTFVLTEEMQWFREASAEYFAARLAYEQGRITETEMHAHLGGAAVEGTLTAPSTWDDQRVAYAKGARVLWLLDQKIRLSTGGERSMVDVFRRLNAQDEPVTESDFRDAVAAVAGHRMDGWLDRYVDGATPVASFYPSEPAQAGPLATLLSAATGASRGVAFFGLALLLSGVGSVPLYRYLDRHHRNERPGRPI